MTKVLVTGASGFIGQALSKALNEMGGLDIVFVARCFESSNSIGDCFSVGSFNGDTDFNCALKDVDIVIHLAGIAHDNNKTVTKKEYRVSNVDATLKLAKQSMANKVKRFIFMSSIGVNGVQSKSAFKHNDCCNPEQDYAISKLEAEIGLKKIARESGMELVIIRPPLVYGKGAPGNFNTLIKVAKKNFPLPLGGINNARSFVAVDNLVDLILTCISHPSAANNTFLVSDGENISTPDFLKKIIIALGKKPCLIHLPVPILKFLALIFGKKAAVDKLSSSLVVDINHTKNTLNWQPPITLDEGIRRCFK